MAHRKIWWTDFAAAEFHGLDPNRTIAVFPTAAVEQHGPHLPVGTDTIINQGHLDLLVERLPADLDVRILPIQAIGKSNEHIWQIGTISGTATTIIEHWTQIGLEVARAGIRQLVFVNSHGGNVSILDVAASDLGHAHHGAARIAVLTYFHLAARRAAEFRDSAPGGMGHACEFETSLMLHLFPEQVRMERAQTCSPDAGSPYLMTDLFEGGRARTYLDFKDLSPTGTFGDPGLASAEKGARILEICAEEVAAFLGDFAGWSLGAAR